LVKPGKIVDPTAAIAAAAPVFFRKSRLLLMSVRLVRGLLGSAEMPEYEQTGR
jgi:hypothetical protein